MEWGKEIAVNGVRPDWLTGEDAGKGQVWNGRWCDQSGRYKNWAWSSSITKIRLPADHPYYTVQRYNEQHGTSFVYWPGGDAAPADWDGGDVFAEAGYGQDTPYVIPGRNRHVEQWGRNDNGYRKIIGYTRRSEPTRDTVAVERMTEAECDRIRRQLIAPNAWDDKINSAHEYAWLRCARHFGLIRPEPTEAERIAAETGVPVETVQRVLDARR